MHIATDERLDDAMRGEYPACGLQAPHEPRDRGKLAGMVSALEAGESLPPVRAQGTTAFEGSHRIAAWSIADQKPDVIEVDDEDYRQAVTALGLDPDADEVNDYDELVAALTKLAN